MIKSLLTIFGVLSRLAFEFIAILLAILYWGWQVGAIFILWYIVWVFAGLYLVKITKDQSEKQTQSNEDDMTEFYKAMEKTAYQYNKDHEKKE